MKYSCSAYDLVCNECGQRFGNQPLSACPDCFAPLEVQYDLDSARGEFTRASIAAGPANIWRYARLLPIPEGFQPDLPVGFTPLVRAQRPLRITLSIWLSIAALASLALELALRACRRSRAGTHPFA